MTCCHVLAVEKHQYQYINKCWSFWKNHQNSKMIHLQNAVFWWEWVCVQEIMQTVFTTILRPHNYSRYLPVMVPVWLESTTWRNRVSASMLEFEEWTTVAAKELKKMYSIMFNRKCFFYLCLHEAPLKQYFVLQLQKGSRWQVSKENLVDNVMMMSQI